MINTIEAFLQKKIKRPMLVLMMVLVKLVVSLQERKLPKEEKQERKQFHKPYHRQENQDSLLKFLQYLEKRIKILQILI